MHRVVTASDAYHRIRWAANQGSRVQWDGNCRWTAFQASRCERPFIIEWTGREEKEGAFAPVLVRSRLEPWRSPPYVGRDKRGPLRLFDQHLPCRRCKWCLKVRAMTWQRRAETEIAWGQRTWFGTLTLSPQSHYAMECRARASLENHQDAATLSRDIFWVNAEISKEITKWLKRIRKESGASLRYVSVAELHKSGKLHYHILVTEVPGSRPVLHKTLKAQWLLGFSRWKLVADGKGAGRYVSKYLAKEALARVRASRRYGEPPQLSAALVGEFERTHDNRSPNIVAAATLNKWNAVHGSLDGRSLVDASSNETQREKTRLNLRPPPGEENLAHKDIDGWWLRPKGRKSRPRGIEKEVSPTKTE